MFLQISQQTAEGGGWAPALPSTGEASSEVVGLGGGEGCDCFTGAFVPSGCIPVTHLIGL